MSSSPRRVLDLVTEGRSLSTHMDGVCISVHIIWSINVIAFPLRWNRIFIYFLDHCNMWTYRAV